MWLDLPLFASLFVKSAKYENLIIKEDDVIHYSAGDLLIAS